MTGAAVDRAVGSEGWHMTRAEIDPALPAADPSIDTGMSFRTGRLLEAGAPQFTVSWTCVWIYEALARGDHGRAVRRRSTDRHDIGFDCVIRMRSQTRWAGDQPSKEILYTTVLVQLPEQRNGVRTVKTGAQDEERKNAAPDLPTGYGCVGDREFLLQDRREGRPAVSVAGGFFSYS